MINSFRRRAISVALAFAIAGAAIVPVSAAPVMPNPSLTSSLPSHVMDVRGRRGAWIGAGVATGLILGGIAASRANPYYAPQPYYAPGYAPGYAYGPAPVYVDEEEPIYEAPPVYVAPRTRVYREPAPANGIRQCYVVTNRDHNLGYWQPC